MNHNFKTIAFQLARAFKAERLPFPEVRSRKTIDIRER